MDKEKPYHHKDLKSLLIKKGTELLKERGYEKFSLRKVAAMAEVSHTALYRHYRNKEDLIIGISQNAYSIMDLYLVKSLKSYDDDPLSQLRIIARNYIHFAIENSDLLSILFHNNPKHMMIREEGIIDSFDILKDIIIKAMDCGAIKTQNPHDLSLLVWSTIHGLANIVIHRNTILPDNLDEYIDKLIETLLDLLK